jgi:hypothetical protein
VLDETDEDISPEAQRVCRAIKDLVDASISEHQTEHRHSMGTYYEEVELEKSITALLKKYGVSEEAPDA